MCGLPTGAFSYCTSSIAVAPQKGLDSNPTDSFSDILLKNSIIWKVFEGERSIDQGLQQDF